jgi:hypothetical protein
LIGKTYPDVQVTGVWKLGRHLVSVRDAISIDELSASLIPFLTLWYCDQTVRHGWLIFGLKFPHFMGMDAVDGDRHRCKIGAKGEKFEKLFFFAIRMMAFPSDPFLSKTVHFRAKPIEKLREH